MKDYLQRYFNTDCTVVGLADALKADMCELHDVTLEELEELKNTVPAWRSMLVEHGAAKRKLNPDYWLNKVLTVRGNLIIPDVRFLNEVQGIQCAPHSIAKLVRITSTREVRNGRGTLSNESDPTETELDDYTEWDLVLENDECHFPAYNLPTDLAIKLALFLNSVV